MKTIYEAEFIEMHFDDGKINARFKVAPNEDSKSGQFSLQAKFYLIAIDETEEEDDT